jgi:hypothetical protein
VPDDKQLQDALQAVRWAYEREEEVARLHHNRAQLVLTVVSAFLGIGVLRLGVVGEGGDVLTPGGAVLLAVLLVAFLLASMIAALYALAGPPISRRRRTQRSLKLVLSPEHLAELATGEREAAFAAVLLQSADALRETAADNELRSRDIQSGLSWFMLALLAAALAVTVHFFAAVELRMLSEAVSLPREVVRTLPSQAP